MNFKQLYIGSRKHWQNHVDSIPVEIITQLTTQEVVTINRESHYFVEVLNPNAEFKLNGMSFHHVVCMDSIAMLWLKNNIDFLIPCMYVVGR